MIVHTRSSKWLGSHTCTMKTYYLVWLKLRYLMECPIIFSNTMVHQKNVDYWKKLNKQTLSVRNFYIVDKTWQNIISRINYSKQWMTWILQTRNFSTSWMYVWILSISRYYKSYKTRHYSILIYEPYVWLPNMDMDYFHVGIMLNMPYTQGLGVKSSFSLIFQTP